MKITREILGSTAQIELTDHELRMACKEMFKHMLLDCVKSDDYIIPDPDDERWDMMTNALMAHTTMCVPDIVEENIEKEKEYDVTVRFTKKIYGKVTIRVSAKDYDDAREMAEEEFSQCYCPEEAFQDYTEIDEEYIDVEPGEVEEVK